ncbi:aminopeptidase N-like [Liolophura sinensis]|uniref:aminopeptidase N-like n=1 Tax=Liolophura sinensis TaxID=3198878 RepID=UPI0031596EF6
MESARRSNDGCFVSATTGFILTFLAILLAVAAGVSVYLIRQPSHVTCHCNCSNDHHRKVVKAGENVPHTAETQENATLTYKVECATQNCSTRNNSQSATTTTGREMNNSYRLPKSLSPVFYNLEIKPNIYEEDPKNFTFEGQVKIMMNCSKETTNVTLHINQLKLLNDSIDIKGGSDCLHPRIGVMNYERDLERQFVIFHLSEALKPGCQYNLTLNFTAPLTDSLSGLFYSSYQHSGSNRYLAATLFSPVYARTAFPCFDEPQLKARFAVTIVRKPNFTSLSNMDIIGTTDRPDGYVADEYNVSPLMSTYLVALVVSDYHQMTKYTKDGTKVRLWAPRGSLPHGELALDVAVKLMEFYADHFEIPYPLPKLDFVSIPDYIVLGMENWGLITFKETYLLYDPLYNSARNKKQIVTVIAHEIAHLWFGDLVTMCWWSELWLKEGFASYLEYIGVHHLFKEWRVWDYFVLFDLHLVLLPDSLGNTSPIVTQAESPTEIQMAFSAIPYSKASMNISLIL